RRIPLGDEVLGTAVVEDYDTALAEIRAMGIRVAEDPTERVMTFGRGYSLDIAGLLQACAGIVTARGGRVLTDTALRELVTDGAAVRGARVRRADGTVLEIAGASVVLATGGFQGARDLLARYMGPNADHLVLRSNPGSVGDGIRAAAEVGAGGTTAMSSFYGHLLPAPLQRFEPADYLPLTQYHSSHSVLVNRDGLRFVDESLGDEIANQALLAQPGAIGVLIFDASVRRTHGQVAPFPGVDAVDRFAKACEYGARWATAATLGELADAVASWGVDADALRATLAAYAEAADAKSPRAAGVEMPATPSVPATALFHALQVQPSITFTFGGLPTSRLGEVLDHDRVPIRGLYAAGADVGGISNRGYAGGLAPSYITGRWAGAAAASAAAEARV
ncbi:MAG: FAD-binding protein, partial [Actinomycetota bacterium]|nr:FAD-binding protein [Actinomycetota bacterium]